MHHDYHYNTKYKGEMFMAQKLILPINDARITAGYKNANYKKQFGYTHYGVDMTDKNKKTLTVWGSGVGEVVEAGWSNTGGNVVVAIYKDCQLTDGSVKDLVIRYYHLDSITVKKGQAITKDTKLGIYGNTGASSGAHLHIEVDTDTKYPCYTPQIAKGSGVLKAGTDSTLNPVKCLWCKTSSPDNQSVTNSGYDTLASSDLKYSSFK